MKDFDKGNSVNIASLIASEIRDIILDQEIAAPSVQHQQMIELEKSTEAQARVNAIQTWVQGWFTYEFPISFSAPRKMTNIHDDTIQIDTSKFTNPRHSFRYLIIAF